MACWDPDLPLGTVPRQWEPADVVKLARRLAVPYGATMRPRRRRLLFTGTLSREPLPPIMAEPPPRRSPPWLVAVLALACGLTVAAIVSGVKLGQRSPPPQDVPPIMAAR